MMEELKKLANKSGNALEGTSICLVGFDAATNSLLSKVIRKNGGNVGSIIARNKVTHLATTNEEINKVVRNPKIEKSITYGIPIVSSEFIIQSINREFVMGFEEFLLIPMTPSQTPQPIPKLSLKKSTSKNRKSNDNNLEPKSAQQVSRTMRIFISSTFVDMQHERDCLINTVFPALRSLAASRGVNFSYVDLRWGITEEESASGDTLTQCLKQVDRCRPYFIGILGERYGWSQKSGSTDAVLQTSFENAAQNPEYAWVLNYADRSVTEIEMLHGALNDTNTEKKMKAFFYLRDSRLSQSLSPGAANAQDIETKSKLIDLKHQISTSLYPHRNYNSIHDFGTSVLRDWKKVLEEDFPIEDAIQDPLEAERHSHTEFMLAQHRDNELINLKQEQELFSALSNFVYTDHVGGCVVHGDTGAGKTCALAKWGYQCTQYGISIIPHFVGASEKSSDCRALLLRLTNEIARLAKANTVDLAESDGSKADISDLIRKLEYSMTIYGNNMEFSNLVILIDGVDKLDYNANWLLSMKIPQKIRLVVSIAANPSFVSSAQAKGWLQSQLTGFLDKEDRINFTVQYLAQQGKKFSKQQLDTISGNSINAIHNNPQYIKVVLDTLTVSAKFENLNYLLGELLQCKDLCGLYEKVIATWEENLTKSNTGRDTPVSLILKLLYVSRYGLTESEILELLKTQFSVKELTNFQSIFIVLSSSLLAPSSAGFDSITWKFQHQHLQQAVFNKYFKNNSQEASKCHKIVSSYLWEQYSILSSTLARGKATSLRRRLSKELPYHLIKTSETQKLKEFLLDWNNFVQIYSEDASSRIEFIQAWKNAAKDYRQISSKAYTSEFSKLAEFSSTKEAASDKNCLLLVEYLDDISEYSLATSLLQSLLAKFQTGSSLNSTENSEEQHSKGLFKLSSLLMKQAQYEESLKIATQCLRVRELTKGFAHIETGQAVSLIALIKKKQADYRTARSLYQRAQYIVVQQYGEYHPQLAWVLNCQGDVARKLDNYAEALQCYQHGLQVLSNFYGYQIDFENVETISAVSIGSPLVIDLFTNIGLVYKKYSMYENAKIFYDRAYELAVAIFGDCHSSVATLLTYLGDVDRKLGYYDSSTDYYHKALDILQTIHNPSEKARAIHPDIAEVYADLGLVQKKKGDYNLAKKYYVRSLHMIAIIFGKKADPKNLPCHPKVATVLSYLGDVNRKLDAFQHAQKNYEEALKMFETLLGQESVEVAETLVNLGLILKKKANYTEAEKQYQRALNILQKLLGKDHPKYGFALSNMADVRRKQGAKADAEFNYQKSIEIIENSLGPHHIELLDPLNGLGLLYNSMNELDKAKVNFERALDIAKAQFGEQHYKYGVVLCNYAQWKEKKGYKQEALEDYHKAAAIIQATLGSKNEELAEVFIHIAQLLISVPTLAADKGQARKYLEKALQIIEHVFGSQHPKYASCKNQLSTA